MTEYEALLYEAISEPLGVIVRCNDPMLLRQKLYVARRTDPAFECLSFVESPTASTTELYIVRKPEVVKDAD